MTLSQDLAKKSNGIIKLQPEVSDTTGRYMMFDDGGVETEVGEFLYGFVRIMKPKDILETGTYSGISTMYMAQGLIDNGEIFEGRYGLVKTLEFEQYHLSRARNLWNSMGLDMVVGTHLGNSLKYQPDRNYQFILLDTEPQQRFAELLKFYPFLDQGGYIAIHDLPNTLCQGNLNPDHPEMKSYPYGDVPEEMANLIKDGNLRLFHFPTPRGITFFYKPKAEDYRP